MCVRLVFGLSLLYAVAAISILDIERTKKEKGKAVVLYINPYPANTEND